MSDKGKKGGGRGEEEGEDEEREEGEGRRKKGIEEGEGGRIKECRRRGLTHACVNKPVLAL